MTTIELCKYMERLRKLRNLELDDFTKEIVSTRQYKRYLSGDSEMPYRVFNQLSVRLGFNPVKIQAELEDAKAKQNELIERLYNFAVSHKFDEIDRLIKEHDFTTFVSSDLEMYYKTAMVIHDYYRYKKPKEDCREDLLEIVDYDNTIKKELHDQIELLVLSLLLMFMHADEKEELLENLTNQLLKEKITVGHEFYSRQYVTLRIAREYGIKGDDDKVIDLCLRALELSERNKIHFNYDFFYYYLALSYRNQENIEKKNKYITKLYYYLLFIEDEFKMKTYIKKFDKDFGVTIEDIRKGL